jgi:hypothetical protein
MLDKLDKKWIGFIVGALFPAICFFCYWMFFHSQIGFPGSFINYLRTGQMLQEVTIMCVVANLVIFYLLLNKKVYDIAKGIIYATFGYVGLVLYISLL